MNPWLLICGGGVLLYVAGLAWLFVEARRAPINPDEQ